MTKKSSKRNTKPIALVIENKFSRAEREIEQLRSKVGLKTGVWLFTRHLHSPHDLLESEHHNKVFSVCEKIGNDVIHWHQNNTLDDEDLDAYRRCRDRIGRKLRAVNKLIRERQPTTWEKFFMLFEGFVTIVLQVLPTVGRLLRNAAAMLTGVPVPRALPPR